MTARAPVPGRAQADAAATTTIRMTLDGVTREVQPGSLSLQERFVIRQATGLPFEAFWSGEQSIGEDSVAVLWWVARRAGGEPNLAFREFVAEWVFDVDKFDIEEVTDDEDNQDPEGSGPGSSVPSLA